MNLSETSFEHIGGYARLWIAIAPEQFRPRVVGGSLVEMPAVSFTEICCQTDSLVFSEKFIRSAESRYYAVSIEAVLPELEAGKLADLDKFTHKRLIALILDNNGRYRLAGLNRNQFLRLYTETLEQKNPEDLGGLKLSLTGNFRAIAPFARPAGLD